MPIPFDPRVRVAAERTLLAWQRTGVSLIGLGFVIERFGLFLRLVVHDPQSLGHRGVSLALGVALIVLGGVANAVGIRQYRIIVRVLADDGVPNGYWQNAGVWMSVALIGVAIALAGYFVVAS